MSTKIISLEGMNDRISKLETKIRETSDKIEELFKLLNELNTK